MLTQRVTHDKNNGGPRKMLEEELLVKLTSGACGKIEESKESTSAISPEISKGFGEKLGTFFVCFLPLLSCTSCTRGSCLAP